MAISGASNSSGTFTLGSAGRPFTITDYTGTVSTPITTSQANVTMSFTAGATTTMFVNGTFDDKDFSLNTHDQETFTNLSLSGASTTTTILGVSYNVDTLAINGSLASTSYSAATGTTVNYNSTNSFTNFDLADKTPVLGAGNEYASINGIFSISTTPADKCIDGTFSICYEYRYTDRCKRCNTGRTGDDQLERGRDISCKAAQ